MYILGYSAVEGISCYDCFYEQLKDGTEIGNRNCLTIPSSGEKPNIKDCENTIVPTDACMVSLCKSIEA